MVETGQNVQIFEEVIFFIFWIFFQNTGSQLCFRFFFFFSGEENSPVAPAGIQTGDLLITSLVLYQQAIMVPSSVSFSYWHGLDLIISISCAIASVCFVLCKRWSLIHPSITQNDHLHNPNNVNHLMTRFTIQEAHHNPTIIELSPLKSWPATSDVLISQRLSSWNALRMCWPQTGQLSKDSSCNSTDEYRITWKLWFVSNAYLFHWSDVQPQQSIPPSQELKTGSWKWNTTVSYKERGPTATIESLPLIVADM